MGLDNFLRILQVKAHRGFYDQFVEKNVISSEEAKAAIEEISEFMEDPEKLVIGIAFICFVYKL